MGTRSSWCVFHFSEDPDEMLTHGQGGSVIMRAAGGALEPYWSVFSFHMRPDIIDTLADMKIGEVRTSPLSIYTV